MDIAGLASLPSVRALRGAGCQRVFAKVLAENDNSKNQFYLGGSLDILNVLPLQAATTETGSRGGIIKARIPWEWLQPDGTGIAAPGAQLILYPQYPEVRLSSLIRGVASGAVRSDLITERIAGRILLIGLQPAGRVSALLLPPAHPDARFITALAPRLDGPGALIELPAPGLSADDGRAALLRDLRRIHHAGWIESQRMLSTGEIEPYTAANGVGYTLEAQLGIRPNGRGEPDFRGWEVKSLSASKSGKVPPSKRITLLTPNPTGGAYATLGPAGFIRRYGHVDAHRVDRLNFGGSFRAGRRIGRDSLTLGVRGFDPARPNVFDPAGGFDLTTESGMTAIEWSLAKMIEHWGGKHSRAVYVPAAVRTTGGKRHYRYGDTVYLATGTDFTRFLSSASGGAVIYDPGLKLEHVDSAEESAKVRHQFRVAFGDLPTLYERWEAVRLSI